MSTPAPALDNPRIHDRRWLIVSCALLAWMCAGILLAIPPLSARVAVASMGVLEEADRGNWFSRYVCAFLFGAACGGIFFGWLGDRFGRTKALAAGVLTYSLLAGACYFIQTPEQMLVLWFLACTGVGGVWPNGISLASEALPGISRPWLAGIFGTTANLGMMFLSELAKWHPVTVENWRWVMLVAAAPALLGIIILFLVPESPAWLKSQSETNRQTNSLFTTEVFQPPLLKYTIIGILLGAVPLMGNWGASNWMVPWAGQVQEQLSDSTLKASTQWMKSGGGAIGSLLGGWIASLCGRRLAYFLISLVALCSSFYIFHFLTPTSDSFLMWVFIQGFFGTIYFGWLPLYLRIILHPMLRTESPLTGGES
ncbi:MAG: MFS transporter [Planctomycetaceae bacterium]